MSISAMAATTASRLLIMIPIHCSDSTPRRGFGIKKNTSKVPTYVFSFVCNCIFFFLRKVIVFTFKCVRCLGSYCTWNFLWFSVWLPSIERKESIDAALVNSKWFLSGVTSIIFTKRSQWPEWHSTERCHTKILKISKVNL